MNELSNLQAPKGANRSRKRKGRGIGSRLGKTAGRGHKGAGQRTGNTKPAWFEGGQMPIARRVPKIGFTNIFAKRWAIVNVGDLERFEAGSVVDEAALKQAGLIKGRYDFVKVLGDGELGASLTVVAHKFSSGAEKKITAAGGTVQTQPMKRQSSKRKSTEVVGG